MYVFAYGSVYMCEMFVCVCFCVCPCLGYVFVNGYLYRYVYGDVYVYVCVCVCVLVAFTPISLDLLSFRGPRTLRRHVSPSSQ